MKAGGSAGSCLLLIFALPPCCSTTAMSSTYFDVILGKMDATIHGNILPTAFLASLHAR
jgi:hypothetical protein